MKEPDDDLSRTARALVGLFAGALLAPLSVALLGAVLCGIQKGIPMVAYPDHASAALAGFVFSLLLLGLPAAVFGAVVGLIIGFLKG
jgi:hypothetical protein